MFPPENGIRLLSVPEERLHTENKHASVIKLVKQLINYYIIYYQTACVKFDPKLCSAEMGEASY